MFLMKLCAYIFVILGQLTEAVVPQEQMTLNDPLSPRSDHRILNELCEKDESEKYPPNTLYGPVSAKTNNCPRVDCIKQVAYVEEKDLRFSVCMPFVPVGTECPPAPARSKPVHRGNLPLCVIPCLTVGHWSNFLVVFTVPFEADYYQARIT